MNKLEKHAIVNTDVLVRWLKYIKAGLDEPVGIAKFDKTLDKIQMASVSLGDLIQHLEKTDEFRFSS